MRWYIQMKGNLHVALKTAHMHSKQKVDWYAILEDIQVSLNRRKKYTEIKTLFLNSFT